MVDMSTDETLRYPIGRFQMTTAVTPEERGRFLREIDFLTKLDHPHIVSVYDVGEHRGVQFYAMRLVEGGSLAARMADWSVPKAATRAAARGRPGRAPPRRTRCRGRGSDSRPQHPDCG